MIESLEARKLLSDALAPNLFGGSSGYLNLGVASAKEVGSTDASDTSGSLVMYTYSGDANLSGKVNADDYFVIDSNYNKSAFNFYQGDFNYDGMINGDDYFAIDQGFSGQGSQGVVAVGSTPRPFGVYGTSKADRILISAGSSVINVSVNGHLSSAPSDALLRIFGSDGDDVVWIDPNLGNHAVTIYGGVGNDTIISGGGSDHIFGEAGDDSINAGDGDDTVYGGSEQDSIRGGGGSDFLSGEDGDDTLRGDAGNDHLLGNGNADRLRGSAGNDTLEGGGSRDLLAGEAGDDSLDGGKGPDVIDGGAGADVLRGGADVDQIDGSDEADDIGLDEVSSGEVQHSAITSGNAGSLTKVGSGTLTLSSGAVTGNLTVTSGTLELAPGAQSRSTLSGNIAVTSGADLKLAQDNVSFPDASVHIDSGGVMEFTTSNGSATFGSLELDAGSYISINAGNYLHIAKAGGFVNHGATIKLFDRLHLTGEFPLIDFSGALPNAHFTLIAPSDTHYNYTLRVDQPAGKVFLVVSHA